MAILKNISCTDCDHSELVVVDLHLHAKASSKRDGVIDIQAEVVNADDVAERMAAHHRNAHGQ